MQAYLPNLLFIAGIGQLSVLVASALVPIRLKWRDEFQPLSRLHRQMYWVYGGYVVAAESRGGDADQRVRRTVDEDL